MSLAYLYSVITHVNSMTLNMPETKQVCKGKAFPLHNHSNPCYSVTPPAIIILSRSSPHRRHDRKERQHVCEEIQEQENHQTKQQ